MSVVYADHLFSIGSIMVYELKPGPLTLFGATMYYWKYKDALDFYGPFNSIMEATRHWESTQNMPPVVYTNVIKVDFRAKKRIK